MGFFYALNSIGTPLKRRLASPYTKYILDKAAGMLKITDDLALFFHRSHDADSLIPVIDGFDCYYSDGTLIYQKVAGGLTYQLRLLESGLDKCQDEGVESLKHVVMRKFSETYSRYLLRGLV